MLYEVITIRSPGCAAGVASRIRDGDLARDLRACPGADQPGARACRAGRSTLRDPPLRLRGRLAHSAGRARASYAPDDRSTAQLRRRITSYNVCYTKLLRDRAPATRRHRAGLQGADAGPA